MPRELPGSGPRGLGTEGCPVSLCGSARGSLAGERSANTNERIPEVGESAARHKKPNRI